MRKLLFLSLFVSFSFFGNGQYLRVAKQGRTWYNFAFVPGPATYFTSVLTISGDTVINGEQVFPIQSLDTVHSTPGMVGYISEDTLSGMVRVYRSNRAGTIYDTATYDFSLTQGDTISNSENGGNEALFVADSVFYLQDFRGVTRKHIWLSGITPNTSCTRRFQLKWIEGIGSESTIFKPFPTCFGTDFIEYSLTCVFDFSTKIYGDTVQECYKLSTNESEFVDFSVYPNPAKYRLKIETQLPLKELRLYDLQGRLVLQKKDPEEWLDVSALKPGLFILEVVDQDDRVGRKKLQKE